MKNLNDFFPGKKAFPDATFPKRIKIPKRPPIKMQGIKTELVQKIASNVNWKNDGWWREPFMGCYDKKTEVMTKEHGFVYFEDLNEEDKVASLVNGHLEFVKPTRYFKYYYKGQMYHVKSRSVDILVTPNHKLYYKETRRKKFMLDEIRNIHYNSINLRSNSNWIGEYKKFFSLPVLKRKMDPKFQKYHPLKRQTIDKILMDDWLEFMGYFISEGSTTKSPQTNGRGYVYIIQIRQNEGRKKDKMRECLERLPFRYNESKGRFRIFNKQLYVYLANLGKSKEKYIPTKLKELSRSQLKILFEALMLGDGYRGKNGNNDFYFTISRRLCDDFCELLLKIGYSFTVHIKKPRTSIMKEVTENGIIDHLIIGKNVTYNISIRKSKNLTIRTNKHFLKEKHEGFVYCVEVPSHVIYVRRNGKSCWCGNSGAVLFNLLPARAVVSDINPHVINFYNGLKRHDFNAGIAKRFLERHGKKLRQQGGSYYYEMRDAFNKEGDPLQFLFLLRSCYNGLMRFNQKGGFNASFCKKPERFDRALITKIYHQVQWVSHVIDYHDYHFKCHDWKEIKDTTDEKDYVYLDPPYSNRDTGYFTKWDYDDDDELIEFIANASCHVMLSTWKRDAVKENPFYEKITSKDTMLTIKTFKHVYQIGQTEETRNFVEEALIINHSTS